MNAAIRSHLSYELPRTSSVGYTDDEIIAAIERALDDADDEELFFDENSPGFARGSDPQLPTIADVEDAFFASGDALSEQHRAEAEALERREGYATVKASRWRRRFSRGRHPSYA